MAPGPAQGIPGHLALIAPEDLRLRRQSCRVARADDDIRRLVRLLFHLMYREQGLGLAAPQAGVLLRVIVVDVSAYQAGTRPLALINPVVKSRRGGYATATEGCLSLPGLEAPVRRARQVRVEGWDEQGAPVSVEAAALLARALQHEIDHLNGILFIDRVNALGRWRLRRALSRVAPRPSPAAAAHGAPAAR